MVNEKRAQNCREIVKKKYNKNTIKPEEKRVIYSEEIMAKR
jgi:hypothetical protein